MAILSQPNFISDIPNPFEAFDNDYCKPMNDIIVENEMGCQIFGNTGLFTIGIIAVIGLKLILVLVKKLSKPKVNKVEQEKEKSA
jgi:hypothetical protein